MLAGLQGAGKTTLAGKLALWLKGQGHTPLLIASDLQRPNAVQQLQIVGEQAGVPVWAPEPGNGIGDPVAVAKSGIAQAQVRLHDIVIVDTAGRLGVDAEMMQQAVDIRDAVNPNESAVRGRRDDRPGRGGHRGGVPGRRRLQRRGADQARR